MNKPKEVVVLTLVILSFAALASCNVELHNSSTREVAGLDPNIVSAFYRFMKDHGKEYSDQGEFQLRLKIFAGNFKKVQEHNKSTKSSWKMGINKFSDLTEEEFLETYTMHYRTRKTEETRREGNDWRSSSSLSPEGNHNQLKVDTAASAKNLELPENVDWRLKGVVTEVKDQLECGSCYAFAAVEQLESYLKLDSDYELPVLSPQQLVSCASRDLNCGGSGGCNGSIPQLSFVYAQLFGVTSEESYPYTATDEECRFDPDVHPTKVFVKGYEVLPHNNQDAVLYHLANVGPLVASVAASKWNTYGSGIFDGCDYESNIIINHVVQLVGYGTDEETGLDFWLARNTWGKNWGEQGYIKLKREKNVQCGLDRIPLFGTGCVGDGNKVQKVCGMCGVLFETTYPIKASPTSGILNEL